MPPKLVLFTQLPDNSPSKLLLDRLNYDGFLQVHPCREFSRGSIREALANASALICRPNDGIEFLPSDLDHSLRPFVAATASSGTDHLEAIKNLAGITIKRSEGGNAAGVAELAISHAMTLTRRSYTAARAMERGLYEVPQGTRVEGKHWLLIGAGEQPAHVIRKALGLGLDRFTVYHDQMSSERLMQCMRLVPSELMLARTSLEHDINVCGQTTTVCGTRDLHSVVPHADIISLHVPRVPRNHDSGRPSTEGMIDSDFLGLTKQPCYLINVARGSLVKEDALVSWLRTHPAAGFASDVLDQRAERHRDPALSLLHQEFIKESEVSDPHKRLNLLLSPHIGGSAVEDFERVFNEVLSKALVALKITSVVAPRRLS